MKGSKHKTFCKSHQPNKRGRSTVGKRVGNNFSTQIKVKLQVRAKREKKTLSADTLVTICFTKPLTVRVSLQCSSLTDANLSPPVAAGSC